MNKCMGIHETVLGDIMSTYDDLKAIASASSDEKKAREGLKNARSRNPLLGSSSIAKATSNMTLVFPVICSRGIAIENSSMVVKALEKNAVTMLQRLFAAYQYTDAQDLQSYLQKFHNNISSGVASLDDIYKLTIAESVAITAADRAAVMQDMKNIDFYLPDAVNETALTSYTVHEGAAHMSTKPVSFSDYSKDKAEFYSKQVPDGDFKKANELMPTMMTVTFKVYGKDGSTIDKFSDCLVGVKAKLYPISSNDIIEHISDKVAGRNWLTNFFRASTREISFLKDLILGIDKAKADAQSMSKLNPTADKMWKVLERRATNSKFRRLMLSNNNAAAITTLCVSQEEVEYLRKNHNVDLESLSVVRGLFESLNLMAIVIVDETLEVAKFIYDDAELMWETISFTHLERESSDNTYKRVVNLMTKMSH